MPHINLLYPFVSNDVLKSNSLQLVCEKVWRCQSCNSGRSPRNCARPCPRLHRSQCSFASLGSSSTSPPARCISSPNRRYFGLFLDMTATTSVIPRPQPRGALEALQRRLLGWTRLQSPTLLLSSPVRQPRFPSAKHQPMFSLCHICPLVVPPARLVVWIFVLIPKVGCRLWPYLYTQHLEPLSSLMLP